MFALSNNCCASKRNLARLIFCTYINSIAPSKRNPHPPPTPNPKTTLRLSSSSKNAPVKISYQALKHSKSSNLFHSTRFQKSRFSKSDLVYFLSAFESDIQYDLWHSSRADKPFAIRIHVTSHIGCQILQVMDLCLSFLQVPSVVP